MKVYEAASPTLSLVAVIVAVAVRFVDWANTEDERAETAISETRKMNNILLSVFMRFHTGSDVELFALLYSSMRTCFLLITIFTKKKC